MRDDTKQLFLCGVASTAAITLIIHLVARRRRRELFLKEVCGRGPSLLDAETVKNLERHRWLSLRHELLQGAVDSDRLQRIFADIVKAFDPQQVDYSNAAYGKNHWQLSCFMEYSSGVAAGTGKWLEICRRVRMGRSVSLSLWPFYIGIAKLGPRTASCVRRFHRP
eukprot:6177383-Pleurochrysis_carterae.AAC.1